MIAHGTNVFQVIFEAFAANQMDFGVVCHGKEEI